MSANTFELIDKGLKGSVDAFNIHAYRDVVTLYSKTTKKMVVHGVVKGFSKWLKKTKEPTVRHSNTPDYNLIGIIDKTDTKGKLHYGYCIDVEHTYLSDWGFI